MSSRSNTRGIDEPVREGGEQFLPTC